MANTAIKGRIATGHHASATGLKGLEVHAYDIDAITGDDFLGMTKTDGNGEFHISYDDSAYGLGFIDDEPDIVLRIYAPGKRLVHELGEISDISRSTYDVGVIAIAEENVKGWLVTHATLSPTTGSHVRLTKGNQIDWLIDGEVFPEITDEMKLSTDWINVTNFNFWVGKRLITKFNPTFNYKSPPEGKEIPAKTVGEQLQEVMKDKAAEGKFVRLVLNNIPYPMNPLVLLLLLLPLFLFSGLWQFVYALLSFIGTAKALGTVDPDTIDEVKEYFKGTKVGVRKFTGPLWYFGFLHAKTVTVDGRVAFVMGASISQSYYSDQQHLIHDARHGGTLMHDVNLRIRGPAVEHVERTFTTLWNSTDTSSPRVPPQTHQQELPDGVAVQVLRTMPGKTFEAWDVNDLAGSYLHGETGVLEAYQRAIANAKDYVYIEDQYLTAPEIVTALIERMNMPEGQDLQAILVLNPEPDIPGYPRKQIELIRQLRNAIPDHENRVGIFTLWSFDETKPPYDKATTPHELVSIYVHSKTAIVDDVWATVGSANLDGASLNESQVETILGGVPGLGHIPKLASLIANITAFFSTSVKENKETARPTQHANPRRSSQPPRQTEVNVVVYNGVDGQPANTKVSELRKRIFREHLGYLPGSIWASGFPASRPPGGWLPLWRHRAKEKCDYIKLRHTYDALVLEWQHESDLEKYLKASKIDTSMPTKISVRTPGKAHLFDFEFGKWKKK